MTCGWHVLRQKPEAELGFTFKIKAGSKMNLACMTKVDTGQVQIRKKTPNHTSFSESTRSSFNAVFFQLDDPAFIL